MVVEFTQIDPLNRALLPCPHDSYEPIKKSASQMPSIGPGDQRVQ